MSAPIGLPGIMVSIVLGVLLVPTILDWVREGNYWGVVILSLGALIVLLVIIFFWDEIVKHFCKR
jgi:predicted membrane channel-forming protein YqfA (hemolysin III family)